MFKTFMNWLLGIEKTAEDNVAHIAQTVKALLAHEEQKLIDAAMHAEAAVAAEARKVAAEADAIKARIFAANLNSVFNTQPPTATVVPASPQVSA